MNEMTRKRKWQQSPFHYLRDIRLNRIIFRNFLTTLVIVIIPAVMLVIVTFAFIISNSRNTALQKNRNDLTKVSSELEVNWTGQKATCLQASVNSYVQTLMKSHDISLSYANLDAINRIQDYISSIIASNPFLDQVVFYFENTQYIVTLNSAWSMLDRDYGSNIYVSIPENMIQDYFKDDVTSTIFKNKHGVYFYRNMLVNGKRGGAVLLRDNYLSINGWLRQNCPDPSSRILILDSDQSILADSMYNSALPDAFRRQIQDMALKGTGSGIIAAGVHLYTFTTQKSAGTGWTYVLISPATEYEKNTRNVLLLLLMLVAAILIAALILSWYISLSFYRPIQVIHYLLEHPEEGVNYEEAYSDIDELGLISTLIKQSHFQRLMITDELKSKKEMLRKAQNVALQAQINPHFIFNTLECINWKILSHFREENDITAMLGNFSKLLRLVLQNGDNFVTIRTEIEHAKLYLDIRAMQSRNSFTVDWDLDEAILDYTMPSLILQPIVENAFTHGIRKLDGTVQGHIVISCTETEQAVAIEVEDNGPGMTAEALQDIRRRLSESMMIEFEHIGLYNVHQRIQLTFGEEWGLSIDSEPGRGAKVKINIPKVRFLSPVDIYK